MKNRPYRGWRRTWWRRIEDGMAWSVSWLIQTASLPFVMLGRFYSSVLAFRMPFRRRSGRFNWFGFLLALSVRPFIEVGRLFRWVFESFVSWLPHAQWRYFFQGLPAVMLAGAVIVPLLGESSTKDPQRYFDAAREAFEHKNYETAEIFYRALVQLQPDNDIFRYNMARTVEASGRRDEASALMNSLAPRDAQGFPLAHLWQALQLLRDPAGGRQSVEFAEAHLLRAVRGRGKVSTDAHALLGQMYLASGRWKQAEEHFAAAAVGRPEMWIALARVHVLQGQLDQGRRDAEKALEYYSRLEESDLDNHEARLFAAEALTFLERFGDAAAVLDKGFKVSTDLRYPVALGRVYLTWEESLRRSPKATVEDHQTLLIRAFEYDPTSKLLMRRMINGLRADGAETEIVRGVVRNALGRGKSLSIVNVLLAIDASDRGEMDSASIYLSRARDVDPRVPQRISEIAHSYVDFPPPSVPQAMAMVDLGLKVWPNDAELRYCRGDLLARNGQWLDALMDLEIAAKSKPDDRNVHRLIAEVYQRLGMPDKAGEHLRKFQQSR